VVLDGELVAGDGRPDAFYRLGGRMARRRFAEHAGSVTFAAFDVLCVDGELVVDRPYEDRRVLLEQLDLAGAAWCTVTSLDGPLDDVLEACTRLGLEGLVAKRADSTYRSGERSPWWVKAKTDHWRHAHAPLRHEGGQ
jgi:bifunctional non-homologous end joining protein LigD